MFTKLSLKMKLILGFGMVAFICAIMGITSYLALKKVGVASMEVAEVRMPSILGLQIMNEAQTSITGNINFLLSKNISAEHRKESYAKIEQAKKQYDKGYNIYAPLPQTIEEAALWKDFLIAHDKWIADTSTFLNLVTDFEKNPTEILYSKISDFALSEIPKTYEKTDQLLEKIITLNVKIGEDATKEVKTLIEFYSAFNLMMALASVLIAFFLGFVIANQISKSLTRISNQIDDSSAQVAAASGELSSSSMQLSNSAQGQAAAVEEASASLTEISGMIEANLKNSEDSNLLAADVYRFSEETKELMNELTAAMDKILESNKKIEKLVKVIEEVGAKTEVIDDIVFKTQLLSFNASVEAERAGEHGRGFAVVAQEVGNLAQMSGKAANEISSIVKLSIKEADEISRENKIRVENGGHLSITANKKITEVMDKISQIRLATNKVVEASKEQSQGINQISASVENINQTTQETASTSEESASASEELSGQAESLMGLVNDLRSLIFGENKNQNKNVQLRPTKNQNKNVIAFNSKKRNFKKTASAKVLNESGDEAWEKI